MEVDVPTSMSSGAGEAAGPREQQQQQQQQQKQQQGHSSAATTKSAAPEPGDMGPLNLHCVTGTRLVVQGREAEVWRSQPCVMGIDEAGRGPVLGPLVYSAAFAPLSTDLTKREFADSKTLTPEKRDALLAAIQADGRMGFCAEILSAHFISELMLGRDRTSLNVLSMDSTIRIIQKVLQLGVNITEVYVDTVGDPDRHKSRLAQAFPGLAFTVCPKADALYPIVSAASIVAKVVRDRALETCQQDLGPCAAGALGTGYPSDPATKAWLKTHLDPVFGFCPLVRFSWETTNRIIAEEGLTITFEVDVEPEGGGGASGGGHQQRLSFAPSKPAAVVETTGTGRSSYFRVRRLQPVTECF